MKCLLSFRRTGLFETRTINEDSYEAADHQFISAYLLALCLFQDLHFSYLNHLFLNELTYLIASNLLSVDNIIRQGE